jgi:hypothetical protein
MTNEEATLDRWRARLRPLSRAAWRRELVLRGCTLVREVKCMRFYAKTKGDRCWDVMIDADDRFGIDAYDYVMWSSELEPPPDPAFYGALPLYTPGEARRRRPARARKATA